MTTEVVKVTTPEIMSAEVGMTVMECIVLDGCVQMRDTFAAHDQKKKVEAMMADLDCVQLSEAMYHYEKATGKLDPQNTYLR